MYRSVCRAFSCNLCETYLKLLTSREKLLFSRPFMQELPWFQLYSPNATIRRSFPGQSWSVQRDCFMELLGAEARLLPCPRLEEVFDAVLNGTARYGVVPVENTLAGSVLLGVDLLIQHELVVIGETVCRIEHAVIGAPGVQLKDVRKVMSHPVALAQCELFFHTHPEIQPVPEYDTAGAVEKVIRENLRDCAAIAGKQGCRDLWRGLCWQTRFRITSKTTRGFS